MYRAEALRTIMQQLHHHMKKRGNWKKEDVVFSIIQADRLLGRRRRAIEEVQLPLTPCRSIPTTPHNGRE